MKWRVLIFTVERSAVLMANSQVYFCCNFPIGIVGYLLLSPSCIDIDRSENNWIIIELPQPPSPLTDCHFWTAVSTEYLQYDWLAYFWPHLKCKKFPAQPTEIFHSCLSWSINNLAGGAGGAAMQHNHNGGILREFLFPVNQAQPSQKLYNSDSGNLTVF